MKHTKRHSVSSPLFVNPTYCLEIIKKSKVNVPKLKRAEIRILPSHYRKTPAAHSAPSRGLVVEREGAGGEGILFTQACSNERLGLVDGEDLLIWGI